MKPYADTLTPAERSAAWVIESWLLDESTLRYLAGRFTSGPDLFDAYLSTLDRLDDGRDHELATDFPGGYVRDQHMYAGRVAVQRGPTAGTIARAGRRVFTSIARMYLVPSVVHGVRGWMGIAGWRGMHIHSRDRKRTVTPIRDRSATRPVDRPMWSRS